MASPNILMAGGNEDEYGSHLMAGGIARLEGQPGQHRSFAELSPAEASTALGAPAVRRSVYSDHSSSLSGYYLG